MVRQTPIPALEEMYQWNRYPTYDVYVEMMNHFAETYPALCHLDTIGTSVEGRLILSLVMTGTEENDLSRPEFFYTSTMHGDERLPCRFRRRTLRRHIRTLSEKQGGDIPTDRSR